MIQPPATIRLALVMPSLAVGGGIPAVAKFVRDAALRSGRCELTVVSLSTSSDDFESVRIGSPSSWLRGAIVTRQLWDGLSIVHVGAVGGELEFQRYRRRRVLTEVLRNCDVIQVVSGTPAWANAVLGLGKPVALQVATRARVERRQRDATPQGFLGWWRRGMTEITDRLDNRALRRVDAIQVMNPWMLDYAEKMNESRAVDLRFIPPGINTDIFQPDLNRQLKLHDRYILCVARLNDPRKNIGLLLEAYALLPPTLRDEVRLVLAGSSGPPENFWQRAEFLGLRERISYVPKPEPDELVRLYQGASIFALPSDEEGLGVVLLEAMACGVPVISTRSGGPEGIISDGVNGYLVPLNDPSEFKRCLSVLLEQPAIGEQMGLAARELTCAKYNEQTAGKTFVEMWTRLLDVKGSP